MLSHRDVGIIYFKNQNYLPQCSAQTRVGIRRRLTQLCPRWPSPRPPFRSGFVEEAVWLAVPLSCLDNSFHDALAPVSAWAHSRHFLLVRQQVKPLHLGGSTVSLGASGRHAALPGSAVHSLYFLLHPSGRVCTSGQACASGLSTVGTSHASPEAPGEPTDPQFSAKGPCVSDCPLWL